MGKMTDVVWTKEQQAAIAIRKTDTLVSAAAGSGKTAVLVERVIQKITDSDHPVDVDRLLVVTFTNAAARQMKQKIAAAIVSEIEKNPHDDRLRHQLALLGNAGINTMHAFCLELVKQHFQKTALPYDFKIADPAEGAMLKQDALEETLGMLYEQQGEKVGELVEWYGGRDDQPLLELILHMYEFLRSVPFYQEWLKQVSQVPEGSILDTAWGVYLKEYALVRLQQCISLAKNTIERLKLLDEGYGLSGYAETFAEDCILLQQLIKQVEEQEWDVLTKVFDTCKFSTMKRLKKDGDAELAEEFKTTRQTIKDIVSEIGKYVFFQSEKACFADLKKTMERICFLSEIILLFEECYAEKKRQRSLVDFGDLEHLSIGILSERNEMGELMPSAVAYQLQEQYEEVLIDEYQDTNDVQELIFSLTAGKQKRFMVGDIKQSIYSFRNSKPELFLEKYQEYSKTDGKANRRLLLSKNFRSNASVLACCNFVFSKMMCKECG
ncbi:MAG: helicase-exonuclease AddAB subunit AddA, partial [Ruminococcaceae bacterium]|nr:helicase-exonuclease AddAB subunit AddA [Oscillospiraceae bacterium]